MNYDYTAGWFDEARIGQMVLVWNDPEGLTGDFTEGTVSGADSVTVQDGMTISPPTTTTMWTCHASILRTTPVMPSSA